MSIEEMNQYWESLSAGDLSDCGSLRQKFEDDKTLTSILDMLDELFELSVELRDHRFQERFKSDSGAGLLGDD